MRLSLLRTEFLDHISVCSTVCKSFHMNVFITLCCHNKFLNDLLFFVGLCLSLESESSLEDFGCLVL